MKQTGITDRLEHKFLEEHNTQVQDKTQTVLSYEDVMFPFLALLIGILIALGQLGIETAVMCKKKCTDDMCILFREERVTRILLWCLTQNLMFCATKGTHDVYQKRRG